MTEYFLTGDLKGVQSYLSSSLLLLSLKARNHMALQDAHFIESSILDRRLLNECERTCYGGAQPSKA